MAAPRSLLGQPHGFARDFPRDQMPSGYLWDVVDYVPLIIDAILTGRGGWAWGSDVMGGDALGGILGSFASGGDRLLIAASNNHWYEVDQNSPYGVNDRGACDTIIQNPIQAGTSVVSFDGAGLQVPQLISCPSGTLLIGRMDSGAPKAKVGTYWHQYVVVSGMPSEPHVIRFSLPGNPAGVWDSTSNLPSRAPVTGLAALRSVVIVFHAGTTERIRGTTPTHTGTEGDMALEPLFDRVGCTDPKTIASWQDNVLFADEHGVHVTDGAVIRNIASQGGILYFWRNLYALKVSLAACTFLDYYIITVRTASGATTLICDLNRRQWFRFANVYALSYVASTGGLGMERVWAGMYGTNRLARIGPTFFPATTSSGPIYDADGVAVLPVLETPWYRMGREGRKRSRFAYLSYDVRTTSLGAESSGPPLAPPEVLAAVAPVLEFSFLTGPSGLNYTVMGSLPPTTTYTRYRLPIWRAPYGVALRVRQTQPATVNRIYDLAVDSQALEPSTL